MADVMRINHGVLDAVYQKERVASLVSRMVKHVFDADRKWHRENVNDTEPRERIYNIQAHLINNIICGSY